MITKQNKRAANHFHHYFVYPELIKTYLSNCGNLSPLGMHAHYSRNLPLKHLVYRFVFAFCNVTKLLRHRMVFSYYLNKYNYFNLAKLFSYFMGKSGSFEHKMSYLWHINTLVRTYVVTYVVSTSKTS